MTERTEAAGRRAPVIHAYAADPNATGDAVAKTVAGSAGSTSWSTTRACSSVARCRTSLWIRSTGSSR
ncbi:hypothetical protein SAVERM_2265 [Streptomyces avermitilis MA-4680 = NBRC 14893]|uniref:Uncharacterized protein n=1 Tax=Streptomyces avermitilis (strain ATCC 31267 / DSM 46492 / JCM 5070 / NBRC 14893 / NCIMB 12804 / NRRL 8165 / MA-4680) TaxID=227882 RepID=Q82KU8_STRAW|nr:hypothetical protein SAVERM_2265 [Streptomyces avermitilis MA-4680 = NBRC 14893]